MKSHRDLQKEWLDKLEGTLTKMKDEVEERKKAKELYEQKRQKLLAENKKKQESILRQNQEKRERQEKKKKLQERWAMARWITQYIDENEERWKKEKEERSKTESERAEEWKKLERFEKIRLIKEKAEETRIMPKIKLREAILTMDQAEQRTTHQDHSD